MLEWRAPDRLRVSGPLAEFADGYRVDLIERGYSLGGAQTHLRLLADLSLWMERERLEPASLTPGVLERYCVSRRQAGHSTYLSPRSPGRLLGYLDGLGVLPVEETVLSPVDRLLEEFRRYLLVERGMADDTVELYARPARAFLAERSEPLEDDLARLSGAEVIAFVLRESRWRSRSSVEVMVCALRVLLRFLHVQGLICEPLVEAVPSVARRREQLPRGLAAGQVRLLLDSCDRGTRTGRRDYAIVLLLARLGLRCGEVAALRLEDVDWREGELVIRGKGSRIDRLPLPSDVGEALAEYLRDGRQRGFGRTLFLKACAPVGGLSRDAVSDVVVRACERAGIPPVRAHRLRHTLASELLRCGAGLAEIAQVLRHHDLGTTVIYAKIDRQALAGLALPWPGSER